MPMDSISPTFDAQVATSRDAVRARITSRVVVPSRSAQKCVVPASGIFHTQGRVVEFLLKGVPAVASTEIRTVLEHNEPKSMAIESNFRV